MTHVLKTWPDFFKKIDSGEKNFEIRKNDRGFKVGDSLILEEYNSDQMKFTGRKIKKRIVYVTDFMQKPGYIVMGLAKCENFGIESNGQYNFLLKNNE